jgi:hypothetical protein
MNGMFTGSPRLLIRSLPWTILVIALKYAAHAAGWEWLELSPLLAGAIAAEVFIVGFILAGTSGDFKEAERLPGEVAASIETIADECLIIREQQGLPEAQMCLADLLALGRGIREWLAHNRGLDEVMADIRQLNGYFMTFGSQVQGGVTGRLKAEQSTIRKLVIRMDTMRRTSYVSAGYLIAEVTAVVLTLIIVFTDLGPVTPNVAVGGLLAYLLIYTLGLIRDLDNPFEYKDGRPGVADVSLDVLIRHEERLKLLLLEGQDEVAQMPDQSPEVPTAQ